MIIRLRPLIARSVIHLQYPVSFVLHCLISFGPTLPCSSPANSVEDAALLNKLAWHWASAHATSDPNFPIFFIFLSPVLLLMSLSVKNGLLAPSQAGASPWQG